MSGYTVQYLYTIKVIEMIRTCLSLHHRYEEMLQNSFARDIYLTTHSHYLSLHFPTYQH